MNLKIQGYCLPAVIGDHLAALSSSAGNGSTPSFRELGDGNMWAGGQVLDLCRAHHGQYDNVQNTSSLSAVFLTWEKTKPVGLKSPSCIYILASRAVGLHLIGQEYWHAACGCMAHVNKLFIAVFPATFIVHVDIVMEVNFPYSVQPPAVMSKLLSCR